MNGHDEKLEQASEKLELDYSELKELKARVIQNESRIDSSSSEIKDMKTQVDLGMKRIEETSERLDSLEEDLKNDRALTILQIADHCERLDLQSNNAKSHCVLITGTITP